MRVKVQVWVVSCQLSLSLYIIFGKLIIAAGCDSIFSDTDTMIGESTRGAGKTLANDLNIRQLNGIGESPYAAS
jgi:hypothetical protein